MKTSAKIAKNFRVDEKFNSIELPSEKLGYRGRDFISFGNDNAYPDFLVEILNRCSVHKRCVEAKKSAVLGKGITEDLRKPNPEESWNHLLNKVVYDWIVFGAYALEIIWSLDGKSIASIYHKDVSKIRVGMVDESKNVPQVTSYAWSYNWKEKHKYQPIHFDVFSVNEATSRIFRNTKFNEEGELDKIERKSQIYYYKSYTPGRLFYALPEYVAAIPAIQCNIGFDVYHLSNLTSGLLPTTIVTIPGVTDEETKEEISKQFEMSYSGAENGGKIITLFPANGQSAATLQSIENNSDNLYLEVNQQNINTILSAHRITSPLLIGIRESGGGLGNNSQELESAWRHFEFTAIREIQEELSRSLNELLPLMKIEGKIEFQPQAVFTQEAVVETATPQV